MLTADLVQVSFGRKRVTPRYIDTTSEEHLALAASLLEVFDRNRGKPRRLLDAELKELLGTGTGFLLHRGLTKLLLDRCEFETSASVDPVELRQAVFEAAAAEREETLGPSPLPRAEILASVAQRFGIAPGDCERLLYADLKEEQVLVKFKAARPSWLLERYNLALAQGVLLRATALDIQLPPQRPTLYRELFRHIKFCQLLYRVEGTASCGYRIHLDGPLSLFKASNRYGLQMANFLPNLLHCEGWSLQATVLWGKKRNERQFSLSAEDGLVPPRHSRGQWQPEELRWLPEQLAKLSTEWVVTTGTELVDLGGRGVLVPDYVFLHRPSKRRVYMEVFGFWRRGALDSRLKLLRRHGPANLILGLARNLHVGEDDLEGMPGDVYVFREHPVAREVLKRLKGYEGTS